MNKATRIFSAAVCCVLSMLILASCGTRSRTQALSAKDGIRAVGEVTANGKQVSHTPVQLGTDSSTSKNNLISYEEICRSEDSIFYADLNNGCFALQDIATEQIWYSTPNDSESDQITAGTERLEMRSQLIVYYVLKSEESTASFYRIEDSQSGCINKGSVRVEKLTNGIRAVYSFAKSGITIPVTFILTKDGFQAEIDTNDIEEGETSYLIGVNLLPMFGAGNWSESGSLFVPDGIGALIDFNGHRNMTSAYRFNLYGDELGVMREKKILDCETMRMPVFGTLKNSGTLMGIITSGDSVSAITAVYGSDTCGYNAVSSIFNYRTLDSKEMYKHQGSIDRTMYRVSAAHATVPHYTVAYYLLKGENAGYVGMAEKYRSYLLENNLLIKTQLKPEFNLEIYGAVDLSTSFLGIDYTKTQKLTTFSQAEAIIKMLHEKDVKELGIRYIGWSSGGVLNRKMDTSASAMKILGSNGGFKALLETADTDNINIYPDIDTVRFRNSGNGYSLSGNAVRTVFNNKSEQYVYSRSTYLADRTMDSVYLLKGASVLQATEKFLSSYKKYDRDCLSVSQLGSVIYSDFDQRQNQFRDAMQEYFTAALDAAAAQADILAVDSANAYAFRYADKIWNMPVSSGGYDIYAREVPFYQLVLHGYLSLAAPCTLQSKEPELTLLKAIETGSEITFGCTWSQTTDLIGSRYEGLYSTCYENWIERFEEVYRSYMPLLQKIGDSPIVRHYEVSNGVFVTEYENGISTAVNYNSYEVSLNEEKVCGAKDFVVLKGGGNG